MSVPAQSLLEQIGGEVNLRRLVDRFYSLVETDPRGTQLLHLHFRGHGIDHAREEQFNFLSGFFGGRRYYLEKHGHMDVKALHKHIPIRDQDAQDWLALMEQAMQDCALPDGPALAKIRGALRRVAEALVNDLPATGPARLPAEA